MKLASRAALPGPAAPSIRSRRRPRALVTGGGRGVGRACAVALARHGVELILCDHDALAMGAVCAEIGAVGRFCDVASEASVAIFAAEFLRAFPSLDMIVNAAGEGHERMIGMHRVSRALLPALKRGRTRNLLINIPPESGEARLLFRYAHSKQAFFRLSTALATAMRGTPVEVYVACPAARALWLVAPDCEGFDDSIAPDEGPIDENSVADLAERVAALIGRGGAGRLRFAG